MIRLRRSGERGHFDHGWLDTRHTFSFADYFDNAQMGFRSLRVMNEDRVRPGEGFGTHGHRDMEILTYVLSGSLAHKDSLGNGDVLKRDRLQHMRAGTGIRHSEFNGSDTEPVHFYQIWIVPAQAGAAPAYGDKTFDPKAAGGKWQLLASPGGRDGSFDIAQDVLWYRTFLKAGETVSHPLAQGRHGWIQVASGSLVLNGKESLQEGDGASISDEKEIVLKAEKDSEVLLFDLG